MIVGDERCTQRSAAALSMLVRQRLLTNGFERVFRTRFSGAAGVQDPLAKARTLMGERYALTTCGLEPNALTGDEAAACLEFANRGL